MTRRTITLTHLHSPQPPSPPTLRRPRQVSASWLVRELKDSRAETTAVVSEFNKAQRRRSGADILVDSLPAEQQAVLESLSSGPADAALSRRERAAAAQASEIADAEARMRKPAMPPKKKRTAAPKRRPENTS